MIPGFPNPSTIEIYLIKTDFHFNTAILLIYTGTIRVILSKSLNSKLLILYESKEMAYVTSSLQEKIFYAHLHFHSPISFCLITF